MRDAMRAMLNGEVWHESRKGKSKRLTKKRVKAAMKAEVKRELKAKP